MTKHAGYGRYDVEVNGQVVGRAVKRPEGWEATGAMPGVSVTVHGHDSLESACMAIERALMGNQPRTGRAEQLGANRAHYQKAERELLDAYLRLRTILGAFDTPHGLTAKQVWAHTEDRAKGLVSQLGKLREEALIWKGMHAVALEQRDQLRAQVERLLQFATEVRDEFPCDSGTVNALIEETPTQSLAEHDAALLERVARTEFDEFGAQHFEAVDVRIALSLAAGRIRKEATK